MRTIFKYPLYAFGVNVISLPFDAEIKAVGQQNNVITLWAEVEPENTQERRAFYIYGTGHNIPRGFTYIGTAFCGDFVWHVYESVNERSGK
jgi:hypothetical protein